MLRVDFHCHTEYSKDSLTSPEKLLETCQRKGMGKLVITDHNTIAGAVKAFQIDPRRVVIGEEIKTRQGELLAFFVKEEIPAGLPANEAILRLKQQDAFISVSHPFDRLRNGHWELVDLEAILPSIDAVEGFNARILWPEANRLALAFAAAYRLATTAGSDAHAAFELGRAHLVLPDFEDAPSLRAALAVAQPVTSLSPQWVHWVSRYAVWRKMMRRVKKKKQPA